MDGNNVGKCPVMHGAVTRNSTSGTSNREWWPNQLNIGMLHQHDQKSNPMDKDFNYRESFKSLDYKALKQDLRYMEIPVRYRNRIGVSKVSGTVKGTIFAGIKILGWIFKYSLKK